MKRRRTKPPPNERWKPIEDFPDYEISDFGRVRSSKGASIKILTPYPNEKGYLFVSLRIWGLTPKKRVHRLVAEHYIPNPENKKEVNHKKGIKEYNWYKELEWSTHTENIRHSFNVLKRNTRKCPVNQYTMEGKFIAFYVSCAEAGRQTGIDYKIINQTMRHDRKAAGGYIWRYKRKRVNIKRKRRKGAQFGVHGRKNTTSKMDITNHTF